MAQYSWATCPKDVRRQADALLTAFQETLGENLSGVYLHGSLAMGCFNPARSDLDLLVLSDSPMALEIKKTIAETLLRLSRQPTPVEISFLSKADLTPWRFPTPFEYHYSESWRERQTLALADSSWQQWNDERKTDADLAAHVMVARARGIYLLGWPIAEVLPAVPPADYLASIRGDVEDFLSGRIAPISNPVYFVLNACRVLAYVMERHIYSKDEGGAWALAHLPEQYHGLIAQALEQYRTSDGPAFEAEALNRFGVYIQKQQERPRTVQTS